MERVTQLVTRLQHICTSLGETAMSDGNLLWNKLSTIVVIGGQSSGKSSVLEAVVGRDFLPRGTGIVTRRPLVLQLVKIDKDEEWGEFPHAPDKKFYNFDEVRDEISEETDRHLKKYSNRVVSGDPIYLTVYSPNVPNLSLVDMPGLTKVPIDGQPASIVQELEDMARQYIKGENAIILAVTPANADLATSDALRMAREVDPSGERTIGVLTKVDIMDRGTDCRDVLLGKSLKLRHGWVAVVNRGQADINNKVTMQMTRQREDDFFNSVSAYADLPNRGTNFLTEKLSTHLVNEIMRNLPSISQYIDTKRLIEDGLSLLRDPAFQAIEQVHQILKQIVAMAVNHPDCRDLLRFFNLKAEILANSSTTLERLRKDADMMVRTLVDMEASYLSASFFREIVAAESYAYDPSRPKPAFVTLTGELLFERRYDTLPPNDAHLQRIADHVSAYLQIVRSQLLATVPKAIVHCMILPSKESLLSEFQEEVAGKEEPQLRRLINESEEIAGQREGIKKRLVLLQRAAKEISAFM
ncbi:P-loop containing nucleoside triphosphate hydrolase protein [Dunaliella salina]|uniref:P-loop containing nucleoside triphosphate hydrolase protein n=1 Tax=Dunaliella salina TaxID=3046 RepID=A0ABQ7GPT9_DUNSA|nr:P-loop containing nucleoside triphosphate hydrolase protein [Dunaliella salina]|eukprot:KAF5836630.1 P-loop containing nucleoside triphosphate hydrolase protein [Dunaliella salina]